MKIATLSVFALLLLGTAAFAQEAPHQTAPQVPASVQVPDVDVQDPHQLQSVVAVERTTIGENEEVTFRIARPGIGGAGRFVNVQRFPSTRKVSNANPLHVTVVVVGSEAENGLSDEVVASPIIGDARTIEPDQPLSVSGGSQTAGTSGYLLSDAAPNPVIESAIITYTVPSGGPTNLTVFDAVGNPVATLVDGDVASGTHSVIFEARNLAAGRYLYRLSSGSFTETKTMTVVR